MIDTRNKRASLMARSLPFMVAYPLPFGTFSAADRLHLAWLYRGLIEVPTDEGRIYLVGGQRREFRMRARGDEFAVSLQRRTFRVKRD